MYCMVFMLVFHGKHFFNIVFHGMHFFILSAGIQTKSQNAIIESNPHPSHLTPHSSSPPHTSPLTPHTSLLTPPPTHLTPHTSHLIPHSLPHFTPHTSLLTPPPPPPTPHPPHRTHLALHPSPPPKQVRYRSHWLWQTTSSTWRGRTSTIGHCHGYRNCRPKNLWSLRSQL